MPRRFPCGEFYSILVLAVFKRKSGQARDETGNVRLEFAWAGNREKMAKKKQQRFSAAKAVKANARERVGQPKPVRVLEDTPRTGRQAKHKPKLEDVLRHDD